MAERSIASLTAELIYLEVLRVIHPENETIRERLAFLEPLVFPPQD